MNIIKLMCYSDNKFYHHERADSFIDWSKLEITWIYNNLSKEINKIKIENGEINFFDCDQNTWKLFNNINTIFSQKEVKDSYKRYKKSLK